MCMQRQWWNKLKIMVSNGKMHSEHGLKVLILINSHSAKEIYRFNIIFIKMAIYFFTGLKQIIQKIV